MGAGYDISASGSQSISNTAGNKVGPVTFGSIQFGNSPGSGPSNTMLYVIAGVAVAGLALFFAFKE